jgi:hypothetical protein
MAKSFRQCSSIKGCRIKMCPHRFAHMTEECDTGGCGAVCVEISPLSTKKIDSLNSTKG